MNDRKLYGLYQTNSTPTTRMGDGSVSILISEVNSKDDSIAIGFLDTNIYKGEFKPENIGHQMLFDKVETIDILIKALNKAKEKLKRYNE